MFQKYREHELEQSKQILLADNFAHCALASHQQNRKHLTRISAVQNPNVSGKGEQS